jgi:hypothetical protein
MSMRWVDADHIVPCSAKVLPTLGVVGGDDRSRREPIVIAPATETPRGERACAIGLHVAEGHGGWVLH